MFASLPGGWCPRRRVVSTASSSRQEPSRALCRCCIAVPQSRLFSSLRLLHPRCRRSCPASSSRHQPSRSLRRYDFVVSASPAPLISPFRSLVYASCVTSAVSESVWCVGLRPPCPLPSCLHNLSVFRHLQLLSLRGPMSDSFAVNNLWARPS